MLLPFFIISNVFFCYKQLIFAREIRQELPDYLTARIGDMPAVQDEITISQIESYFKKYNYTFPI